MWNEHECIVIVAAHPDDETIGMGAQLGSLREVTIVHVTDGAPRRRPHWKHYAQTRRAEFLRAASLAGIPPERCLEAGVPDQQAAHHLIELSCFLSRIFDELRPRFIFTHPYEGGHPDHDATAFAVHHAAPAAAILEFTSYHRAPRGTGIETGRFLGAAECIVELNDEQKFQKQKMLSCFVSQREMLHWFGVARESFRRAPTYDFTRPPHPGRLFYDDFDWGIDAASWLRQAHAAERAMGSCLTR
jgi:LmbE family N-acetylglucosaminyl deacetylase